MPDSCSYTVTGISMTLKLNKNVPNSCNYTDTGISRTFILEKILLVKTLSKPILVLESEDIIKTKTIIINFKALKT